MLPRVQTTRQSTRARPIAWTGWRAIGFITITATTQHAIQPSRWNAITTFCRSLVRFMSKTELRSMKLSAYCRWQFCLYFTRCFGCTPNHKNWRISQIYWFIDLVGLKTAMSILESQTHPLFWASSRAAELELALQVPGVARWPCGKANCHHLCISKLLWGQERGSSLQFKE